MTLMMTLMTLMMLLVVVMVLVIVMMVLVIVMVTLMMITLTMMVTVVVVLQAPLRSAATREVLQLMTFLLRLELLQNFFTKCLQNAAAYTGTVPSSCYPAPAAGRFGARESYYRLCVASTTSAAMRRAIETPRDTDQ